MCANGQRGRGGSREETWGLEIGLEFSFATHIARGAVERSAKGKEVAERYRHWFESPFLEGVDRVCLVRLHHYALVIEHEDVAGSRPGRSEEQRVSGRQHRSLRHEDIPTFEHGRQLVVLAHALERVRLLLLARDARTLGIHEQFAGTERNKRAVNVHRILVLEIQYVDTVLRTQMTAHPLDAEVVGDLTALHKDIATDTSELRGVEHWFEFRRHKLIGSAHFEILL